MNPRWFNIFTPKSRGVGNLEVIDDIIVKTSPAYRWAMGLCWSRQKRKWEEGGYGISQSRKRPASLDSTKVYKKPKPTATELYKRVSP